LRNEWESEGKIILMVKECIGRLEVALKNRITTVESL
jgi:hypothetical protein